MEGQNEATALSRRDALKRGLVVGGAMVWAVPTVQALGMSAAHADEPSGKTVKPKPKPKPQPHEAPQAKPPATEVQGSAQTLPKTGSDIPVAGITAAAAGAIGIGAVILNATRKGAEAGPEA